MSDKQSSSDYWKNSDRQFAAGVSGPRKRRRSKKIQESDTEENKQVLGSRTLKKDKVRKRAKKQSKSNQSALKQLASQNKICTAQPATQSLGSPNQSNTQPVTTSHPNQTNKGTTNDNTNTDVSGPPVASPPSNEELSQSTSQNTATNNDTQQNGDTISHESNVPILPSVAETPNAFVANDIGVINSETVVDMHLDDSDRKM